MKCYIEMSCVNIAFSVEKIHNITGRLFFFFLCEPESTEFMSVLHYILNLNIISTKQITDSMIVT